MSPIGSILQPAQHSFLAPRFEDAEVVDAMRMGVVSCPPDTSVREMLGDAPVLAAAAAHLRTHVPRGFAG